MAEMNDYGGWPGIQTRRNAETESAGSARSLPASAALHELSAAGPARYIAEMAQELEAMSANCQLPLPGAYCEAVALVRGRTARKAGVAAQLGRV